MSLTIAGANADWIDTLNSGTLTRDLKDANADGSVTFAEMKMLMADALDKVNANGGVYQSLFDDLQTIAHNLNNGVYTSDYVASVFQQLVLGSEITRTIKNENTGEYEALTSKANRVWNGGSTNWKNEYNLASSGSGATAANFKMLVDEWFGGLDRPDGTGDDGTASTYKAMTTATLWDNADGDVSTSDVNQGNNGFCAVLSGMNALVKQNPDILKQIIVDNNDGTYGVRFYAGGDEVWVTVDNQLPIHKEYYSDGTPIMKNGVQVTSLTMNNSGKDFSSPLWASLIEKAFAQASSTGFFYHPAQVNSYANAGGNYPGYILDNFTNTSYFDVKYTDAQWNAEKALVIAALDAGDDIELTSNRKTYNADGIKLFESSHAFSVLSYDSATGLFTVRNPWGDPLEANANYIPQFKVSWADIKADSATLTIDAAASLESPFRIEATGSVAVTDQGTAISKLIRITDLDGNDVDFVRLKVVGDGVIDLNGATDHADDTETADGYVVVSSGRLSTVTYTAGASDTDYLVVGASNANTYGPVEFLKIESDAGTIQVTPHRTRVLGLGETINVASLTDITGVANTAKTWYSTRISNNGGGAFAFTNVTSNSTVVSGSKPDAYGLVDYQALTYTAPQAYGQITLTAQITDNLKHESAFTDFAVWVGNTAATAIQNFNNGVLSKAQAVADTSANIAANLDSLAAMVTAKTLKYIGLTDDAGGRPTVHLTGAQIAKDFAALAVITDSLKIVVDGGIDAATRVLDDQLVALGSLAFEAGGDIVPPPVDPALPAKPTVAQYLANIAAYDKAGNVTVTDGAKALTDASATLLAHAAAVKSVVVSDTAAAIVAGIDTLAKLPVTSVTITDGTELKVASKTRMYAILDNDSTVLNAIQGGCSFRIDQSLSGGLSVIKRYNADGWKLSETYSDGIKGEWTWNVDDSYKVLWTGYTGHSYTANDVSYDANGTKLGETLLNGNKILSTWTYNADGSAHSYRSYTAGTFWGIGYTSSLYDYVGGTVSQQSFLDASDKVVASQSWNADGSRHDIHGYTAGTFQGVAYASWDNFYAGGFRNREDFLDGTGKVVASETFAADGSYAIYIGGVLKQQKTVHADGTWNFLTAGITGQSFTEDDIHYAADGKKLSETWSNGGVPLNTKTYNADGSVHDVRIYGAGTFWGLAYASRDVSYTNGFVDLQTFLDAGGNEVARQTFVSDGSNAVYLGGTLKQQKSVNADGTWQLELKAAGSFYDQTDVIYRASGKAETEVWSKNGAAVRVENWNADGTVANDTALNGTPTAVAPFGGRSSIDLFAFAPGSTTLGFTEDASNTFGVLSLTQGKEHLALTLMGQYAASDFMLAADGFGGSLVSLTPAAVALLAGAHG